MGREYLYSCVFSVIAANSNSIKSLLIFFAPVIIPRAINLVRNARGIVASRQTPRPLPASATRALNVLFCATVLFLLISLPFTPRAPSPNIFTLTRSRLNTPTEIIFNRLARFRPGDALTPADELLRSRFTSLPARKMYLRFGPEALTDCQFCSLEHVGTYVLYYLPFNTLLPHLFNMLVVGLVTSAPFAGRDAAGWRNKFTLAGLALAALDIYIVITYDPVQYGPAIVRAGIAPPSSLYHQLSVLRPLAFAILDSVCAGLIYVTATQRLFFTPPTQAEQVEQLVDASLPAVAQANSKLHALSVTRNAVARDRTLKERDDAYWQTLVSINGENPGVNTGDAGIWEDEEVVRAMSRAMAGQGDVDLAKLGVNANEYVNGVTGMLDE